MDSVSLNNPSLFLFNVFFDAKFNLLSDILEGESTKSFSDIERVIGDGIKYSQGRLSLCKNEAGVLQGDSGSAPPLGEGVDGVVVFLWFTEGENDF